LENQLWRTSEGQIEKSEHGLGNRSYDNMSQFTS
jgi:hypothetical protein